VDAKKKHFIKARGVVDLTKEVEVDEILEKRTLDEKSEIWGGPWLLRRASGSVA